MMPKNWDATWSEKVDECAPVETVHHLQLAPQLFLGEVIKHSSIDQWFHEVGAILRKTQTGQPFISHPFMVHVSIGQNLQVDKDKL